MPSYSPHLRELTVSEALDTAFRLYRERFKTLVACVIAVVTPLCLLDTLTQWLLVEDAFTDQASVTDPDTRELTATGISFGLALVMTTLATAACVRVISAAYLGESADWRDSLRVGYRRWSAVLGATVLTILILFPALLAFIIPGVWLWVALSLATVAIVVERVGAADGLRRSFELTRGNWWRTFGVLLSMFVFVLLLSSILAALAGAFIGESDARAVNAVLLTVASIVALALATPLQAAAIAVIYFDLRVRKERFDLRELAGAFDAPEAPGPGRAAEPAPGRGGVEPAPPRAADPAPPGAAEPPLWPAPPPSLPGGWLPPRPGDGDPPAGADRSP
jgi:hypothetical protein